MEEPVTPRRKRIAKRKAKPVVALNSAVVQSVQEEAAGDGKNNQALESAPIQQLEKGGKPEPEAESGESHKEATSATVKDEQPATRSHVAKKPAQVQDITRKRFAKKKKPKAPNKAVGKEEGVKNKENETTLSQGTSEKSKRKRIAKRKVSTLKRSEEGKSDDVGKANEVVVGQEDPRAKAEGVRMRVQDILDRLTRDSSKERQDEATEQVVQLLEQVAVVMDLLEANGFKDYILGLCPRYVDTAPLAMYSICKRFGVKLPAELRYLRAPSQKREAATMLEAPLTPRRAAVVKAKPMPLLSYLKTELKQKPAYNHFSEGEVNLQRQVAVTPPRKRKDAPLSTTYSPRRSLVLNAEGLAGNSDPQTPDGATKKPRTSVASPFAQVTRSPARRSSVGLRTQRMSTTQGMLQRMLQLATNEHAASVATGPDETARLDGGAVV